MSNLFDELVECSHCGSDACYKKTTKRTTSWTCFTCGFATNTGYTENSATVKQMLNSTAELLRDITDVIDGFVWMPQVIQLKGKGIVFPDGKTKDDWQWAAMKSVPVLEEEKEKFGGAEYKMDKDSIQYFHRLNYMDALEYIGFFDYNINNQNEGH